MKNLLFLGFLIALFTGCGPVSMKPVADLPKEKNMSAKINTLFYWCNDVEPMREFYTDVMGLEETYYASDERMGWLTYDVGGMGLVFIRGSERIPVEEGWAKQPAWTAGTQEVSSVVVEYSLEDFQKVVERAKAAGVELRDRVPPLEDTDVQMMFVRDPMGRTVEIFYGGEDVQDES